MMFMSNVKKVVLVVMLLIASCVLAACNGNEEKKYYVLPNLNGKTINNYLEEIDDTEITVVVKKEHSEIIPEDEFIRYGENLKANDKVESGTVVYIYFSLGKDLEGPIFYGIEDVEIEYASDYFGEFDPKAGVKVIDEVDGEIPENSWRVDFIDELNYYELGSYKIKYTAWDLKGNKTEVIRTVTVVPNELDTRYTDNLKLTIDYEGKTFAEDGIEEVTLVQCIDGDTADFSDGKKTFRVRFLGIDTPETAGGKVGYGAWGKAASDFTCQKLKNAKTIVLEGEGNLFDNYERYLAFVWVDGRLLNLEIIENAYSGAKISETSKYFVYFFNAELKTMGSKRRIWGEIDPDYDYENKKFK